MQVLGALNVTRIEAEDANAPLSSEHQDAPAQSKVRDKPAFTQLGKPSLTIAGPAPASHDFSSLLSSLGLQKRQSSTQLSRTEAAMADLHQHSRMGKPLQAMTLDKKRSGPALSQMDCTKHNRQTANAPAPAKGSPGLPKASTENKGDAAVASLNRAGSSLLPAAGVRQIAPERIENARQPIECALETLGKPCLSQVFLLPLTQAGPKTIVSQM